MAEKKGVIYILTNPSFPEYVKIGYADDIDRRLSELNRTECTPFAFRVYATYDVKARLTDIKIHEMIDRLNPSLRSIDNVNGKKRVREFYAMSAEDAYLMFEAMAEIHGTTDLLVKIQPDEQQQIEEDTAKELKEVSRERMAPFTFETVQIKPGEEIEFWYSTKNPSGIMCKVIDNKNIEVEGVKYSLSAFAKLQLQTKTAVAGPCYFKYKGEWLNDIRHRLEKE